MDVKVIVTSSGRLDRIFSKWGISFLIGDDLLFDTFSNPKTLLANMKKMNIDPSAIKHVAISHDHWDHAGGLTGLLEKNQSLIVYACPGFSNEFKENVISSGAPLMEAEKFFRIEPNIYTTGEIAGVYADFFIAEQSLVVESDGKLSLITGCAHPGIVSIIKEVKSHFKKEVESIIGGFHLYDKSADKIVSITGEIVKLGIKKVYSTHCTGDKAENILRKKFTKEFAILKSGDIISI